MGLLKDIGKCLGLVSESNTDLKKLAMAQLGALGSAISDAASAALSAITAPFTDLLSDLQKEWDALGNAFDSLTDALGSISIDGILSSVCKDATETSATVPKSDPVGKALALPATNDDDVNKASPVLEIKADETKAANTGMKDMAQVVGKVDTTIASSGIEDARQLRRLYIDKYPSLKSYTSKLESFKPISESVGASLLAYTVDKPSLQIKNWKTGAPICIRKNLQPKLRNEIALDIQSTYTALNTGIFNNVSDEYTDTQDVAYNQAQAYHLVGDELFYIDHASTTSLLYTAYAALVGKTLGSRMSFVNYQLPSTPAITIKNDTYGITIEGKSATVDSKGNLVVAPFTKVNNDALKPGTLNDE